MSSTRAPRLRTLDPYLGAVLGGRYRIDRLIGRGGMGLVYLAFDTVTEGEVVIKLLAPHWLEDETAVSRFEREGSRLQQLAHPNVVQLLECGHDRGQSYIAMEYLDGEPLRRFLKRRGPLDLRDFTPIAVQILAAVGYAHDRGIMLRDIKPANIMLCERAGKANFVKVLDFGLAKLVDGNEDEEVTKSHVIGTAGYLAPEQIKGEESDLRVDVYSIGVMLYLMLAGESPIQGENDGALLYNHVHGTPKPLASVLPTGHGIPESLIALVHQCIEKDPARRPADASEIAESLFESVPPHRLALPDADADSRAALAEYRSARDRGADAEIGPHSSEWTKPVVRSAEPTPAELSASGLPRPVVAELASDRPPQPPRRGTGRPLGPRRPSSPEIAANTAVPRVPVVAAPPRPAPSTGAVPPVRMAKPAPAARPIDGAPIDGAPIDGTPIDGAPAVMSSPPRPPPGGEASAPIPVAHRGSAALLLPPPPVSRRWFAAAGVLALLLGGLSAWAIFGPGGPAATPSVLAASSGPTHGVVDNASATPGASDARAPADDVDVDDEPVVLPADEAPTYPVVVRGAEGARVEIDGVDAGAAPLQTALTVGSHAVRVVAPGQAPWEQTIDVVAGQNPIVDARARPTATPKRRKAEVAPRVPAPEIDDVIENEEPEPAAEVLPDKTPPAVPPVPAPVPKPPPAPEPTRGPLLPTTPG